MSLNQDKTKSIRANFIKMTEMQEMIANEKVTDSDIKTSYDECKRKVSITRDNSRDPSDTSMIFD